MRILVTGAAGAVGTAVVKGMKDRYSLRGFDRVPMPDIADTIVGDIVDGVDVTEYLIERGHALPYDGGRKAELDWEELNKGLMR